MLSSSTIFPMPFVIVGMSIFIACIMSKLQNKNSYLFGSAYVIAGILETGSLIYLVIRFYMYES